MGSRWRVVITNPTEQRVLAELLDPRVVALVADLALARRQDAIGDPVLAAFERGRRDALRRLARSAR